ncbi:MAG: TRAP transporter small permease [Hydrogenophaga sp.]|uniref:TRAP transporter small permease subunit n=1 Tax=Hydrogenophaga sp. TaxID=1904254 RepID=UPI0026236746|nr:TRAP transporter small permease subunit [Hydrogenophaga sp.]MCV0438750.1 TRAP transporter small permease [Hydrogenophaga sp.]
MNAIDAALRRAAYLLAAGGLCLLFLNAIATVLDVLGRALFATPIDRLSDISGLIYILAAACCVPAATAQLRHITIKPFEERLAPRPYAMVEGIASLLKLAVWVVLAWQLWVHAAEMEATGQTLSQLRNVRVAPFWTFVALTMSFNALLEALNLLRFGRVALGWIAPAQAAPASPTDTPNML